MRRRWMFGLAGGVVGCGPSTAGDDATAMPSTGSTAAVTGDAGDDDESAGSAVTGPSSAGTGTPMTSGNDSVDGGDDLPPTTGGTGSACINDDLELANVSIAFTTNRVFGEDVPAVFDPAAGDWACVTTLRGGIRLQVQIGPPMFSEPGTRLSVEVYDGARLYDLAVDPAPPGSGVPGLVGFGYMVPIAPASTAGFDTINQAGTGTLEVIALPVDGSVNMEFTAAGEIAGPDGWEFDLHFSGVVPVR